MMKKHNMLSWLLAFCLCFMVAMPAWAADVDSQCYDEWIERGVQGLKYIEEHYDEIEEEAANYQANQITPYGVSYGGFNYLDGDILVSTDSLVDHAAMIVGNKILEIHLNFNDKKPQLITLSDWYNRYNNTYVLRYNGGRTIPVNAASYAQSYYVNGEGRNHTYFISYNVMSKTNDYCSSLVWKCYYYGANFAFYVLWDEDGVEQYGVPKLLHPYDFVEYREYNNFSVVKTVHK